MPRVYGMHSFMLRPEIAKEDFEKFAIEELYQLPTPQGWTMRLLKGEKGDRVGNYLLMIEIESLEARDQFTSGATHDWEGEAQHLTEAEAAVWDKVMDKWRQFSFQDLRANTIFTDYVMVE